MRGGTRLGAGRKSSWISGCTREDTTPIRVPKYLKNQIVRIAHELDAMATENPKISAYVPPEIFERFKKFQEERSLTMSQAATQIIAEYLGINPEGKPTVTIEEFKALEQRITAIEEQVKSSNQPTKSDSTPPLSEFFSSSYEKHYGSKKRKTIER